MKETRARQLLVAEARRLAFLHEVVDHDGTAERGDADARAASDVRGPAAGAVTLEHEVEESLRIAVDDERVEVALALTRLDAGTYGTCGTCGQPIPDERLEVVPATRSCVRCEAAGEVTAPLPMIDTILRTALHELVGWDDEGVDEDDPVLPSAEEGALHVDAPPPTPVDRGAER